MLTMFAVPGWSVSADSLKAEAVTDSNQGSAQASKDKKRKRGNGQQQQDSVDAESVAALWKSVVEGKGKGKGEGKGASKKRQRTGDDEASGGKPDAKLPKSSKGDSANVELAGKEEKQKKRDDKSEKKQKQKQKKPSNGEKPTHSEPEQPVEAAAPAPATAPPPLPPPAKKLTPLQASMRQKLISARFRHLNETLYTRPSEEAFGLFQESPEMFEEYHEGFRQQVKVWPENPVDSFLKDIRLRAKVMPPGKGKPGANPTTQLSKAPLPRTRGTCTFADLGCGDAQLSKLLQDDKKKLHLQVNSYDLQAPNPLITKADIANLPLEDGSINVAIFCLALMGTNWIDFIEEAYRILHWKGELWVAEIKSRFGPVKGGSKGPVTHSVGARMKKAAGKNKKKPDGDAVAGHEDDLAVEVDGIDDKRRETDVSAFVEVLKKRGFVLHGERREAIDLSNKMFVKMRFIKAANPVTGKGAKAPEPTGRRDQRKTFEQHAKEEQVNAVDLDEASILKPCVYKIR